MEMGIINVNIHKKGRISPFFPAIGPMYNISISKMIYSLLLREGVSIYPVGNDPIMKAKIEEANKMKKIEEITKLKIASEISKQLSEHPIKEKEVHKENNLDNTSTIKNNITDTKKLDSIDLAIENRLSELKEEIELGVIQTKDEDLVEVQRIKAKANKTYTKEELSKIKNEELREILNARGHTDVKDPLSPKWRDNNTILREKVLKSQIE
jgi:hypothetical protein